MVWKRRAVLPFIVGLIIFIGMFWQVLVRGYVPLPMPYMLSWYEPWKTENTSGGVPTLPHKPVVDDAFRHLYPLRVIAANIMKSGAMPLWNPYNAAGTPLLAIMHPGYITPFGFVFLFFPPQIAWTAYILFQPVLLGVAMFWYGKKLKLTDSGSMFASMALVLSGFSVVRLEYGEFLYVLSGLPVLLGIVETLRENPRSKIPVWIVPVTAIMIISGQPHMIVYTLSVFALYAFVRLPRAGVLQCALFSGLGVCLAAFQLFPSVELFTRSTISPETSTFIFDKFLLPLSHLITIVIPNFFGNQATYNYFGPHDYVETIAYIGSVPVLFALFSLKKFRKDGVVRFFVLLATLSVLTTVRWWGAQLFFRLPLPVLSSDVPSRVFVLTTFALSILSGIGVSVWEREPKHLMRTVLPFGLLLGAIAATAFALYRTHTACPPVLPNCRMVSLRTSIIELTGFAFAVIFLFLSEKRKLSLGVFVPIAVVVVLGVYNAQKFLPFAAPATVFPELPVISALKSVSGMNRFVSLGSAHVRSNLFALYGLYSTDYFDPLNVRRYAELVSYVNTGSRTKGLSRSDISVISDVWVPEYLSERRGRFLDMTGTNTLLIKKDDGILVAGDPTWSDARWAIYMRATALPRAYLVSDVRVVSDPDRELREMFDPGTDPRSVAFTEVAVPRLEKGMASIGSADIVSYGAESVQIRTRASQSTFLVLSDTYYPGWTATIDGKKSLLYRTNYIFRGIAVPAGEHTVVMEYAPVSVTAGLWVTTLAALAWISVVVRYYKKKEIKKN